VDASTETEESLNSGVEGEWRLQGEVEGISREFAMRQWEDTGRSDEGVKGVGPEKRKNKLGLSCAKLRSSWGYLS
jgi:hypothetical protein